MKKLLKKPYRIVILTISLVLVIVSIILSVNVEANYDMTTYLPESSQTKKGLEVLDQTFGNHAVVELMVDDVSLLEAYSLKQSIQDIEGVLQVVWLDNQADISNPSTIDDELLRQYYHDGHALMQVVFVDDAYNISVESSINQIISTLQEEDIYLRGDAISNIESRDIAEGEMYKIILFIVPICFIILVFASRSWFEPVIVLVVLGIGVVINLGTNIFLPNVSFITLTIAAALQLAISLDYSLFYIHRFYEYRDEGYEPLESVSKAFKKALPIISASALTTIIGFVALFFMRYKIGMDIGIVLTKGIVLSYLSVIFVLPVLIIMFEPVLEKFRHRHFMFHLGGLSNILIKYRYILGLILLVFLVGGIYLNQNVHYSYGSSEYASDDSKLVQDDQTISEQFGSYDQLTILLKDSTKVQELSLINELNDQETIIKIDALYTAINPAVPESMIPESVQSIYEQNQYTRMTIYTTLTEENDAMFAFNDQLQNDVSNYYDEYYILGMPSSINEIKDTVKEDTPIVIFVSIALITLVLILVFRNIVVSILLILVIQAAIWFNVGLLSINDRPVIYIGYLVVFTIQLGATIDYAVLFANRYLEARKIVSREMAIKKTLEKASIPIMISGLVLATAGFAEMVLSNIVVIGDIGLLLGRGALLSMGLVLIMLPGLFYLFDHLLLKRFFHKSIDSD